MQDNKKKPFDYKKEKAEVFNIQKAIQRLQWRFTNPDITVNESRITVNTADQKAVLFLTEWINNQKKEDLVENELFAKMFCYALFNEIFFYNGEVKFSVKKLQEQLSYPIEYHYDKIQEALNTTELHNYFILKGLNVADAPSFRTLAMEAQDMEVLKQKNPELIKKVLGTWDLKTVYKSLNNTITECINRYK